MNVDWSPSYSALTIEIGMDCPNSPHWWINKSKRMKISMKYYRQRARLFGALLVISLFSYFIIRFISAFIS